MKAQIAEYPIPGGTSGAVSTGSGRWGITDGALTTDGVSLVQTAPFLMASTTQLHSYNQAFAFRRLVRNRDGSPIIEFALVAPIFVVLIVNVLDFSSLIRDQMQVDYSAQMGVQAAYKTCSTFNSPITTNCTNLNTQVTAAIQSTSLSTSVTL